MGHYAAEISPSQKLICGFSTWLTFNRAAAIILFWIREKQTVGDRW